MAKRVRKTVSRDGILHSYRKVVKSGHSLIVSLPVAWAKEHGIEQGDVLALTANSILTMSPKPEKREDEEGRGGGK